MKKNQRWWHILSKAVIVGGTMTVPGASGGTMAMILGIYEDLIESVGSLPGLLAECLYSKDCSPAAREPRTVAQSAAGRQRLLACLCFLALFCVGAVAGMALLAKGVLSLLERYPMIVSYFFLGAVAGGIPLICRQANIKKITWQALVWPLTGLFIVYGLASLPEGLFAVGFSSNAAAAGISSLPQYLFQFLGGCILAVALILPGISVSQMLLMLGMYEPVMTAVSGLHFVSLIPLGLGAVLCTLLVTRLLGNAMERHPQPTYLLILGFVLGSLGELYPGLPTAWDMLFAPLAAVAGYQLLSRLSRRAG